MVPQALSTLTPQNVGAGMDIPADKLPQDTARQNGGVGGGPELDNCPSI